MTSGKNIRLHVVCIVHVHAFAVKISVNLFIDPNYSHTENDAVPDSHRDQIHSFKYHVKTTSSKVKWIKCISIDVNPVYRLHLEFRFHV